MKHVPSSWLDTERPPSGWSRADWLRMPWTAREAAVRAMRPPAPTDDDPPWRRAAIDARALLDVVAPNGVGHVEHPRHGYPHPVKSRPEQTRERARSIA